MRSVPTIAAAGFLFAPGVASAHGALQGVGDFYGGLLHPLIMPAELLALITLALLLGSSGRVACRLGLPALVLGLFLGLTLGSQMPVDDLTTPVVLVVALITGLIVVFAFQPPASTSMVLAAVTGLAVGADATPEFDGLRSFLFAAGGSMLGGAAVVATTIAVVLGREVTWQRVAQRTVASWASACSLLYLTWLLVAI